MSLPGKVLVANRGEIAVRIMRTLREMGIGSVAVYHRVDAAARFVRDADESVELPGGSASPVAAYLDGPAVIAAAQRSGAEAVHPGYGFLSENAGFAEALDEAGLTFIGPPADAIRSMGGKIESKRLAIAAGVPVLPGSRGALSDADEALAEAERIGYPILLKASAGGGGKGMRIARTPQQCREAFSQASSEATASFGDGRIFLERYVTQPRHIEVQVLADSYGHVIHLGERECSIQRRYQKVIEESPSPFVGDRLRQQIGESAVALARQVGYTSAGTVEMVVDPEGNAYFLEMNTRVRGQPDRGDRAALGRAASHGAARHDHELRVPGRRGGASGLRGRRHPYRVHRPAPRADHSASTRCRGRADAGRGRGPAQPAVRSPARHTGCARRDGPVAAVTLQVTRDGGAPHDVALTRSRDQATVWIDDVPYPVALASEGAATSLNLDGRLETVWYVTERDTVFVHAFGRVWTLRVDDPVENSLRGAADADAAVAQMPGVLVRLTVAAGDAVARGQVVAVTGERRWSRSCPRTHPEGN
ncbi:MAG: biotin carboxylase N-terminal domain-containing protein [Streptosporangiaceae bacterium]